MSTCFMLQFSVEKQRSPTMRSKYWSKCLNLANHHGKVFCLKAETTTAASLDFFNQDIGQHWSREKVYRYRKNLVPEKSTGPGTGKNSWYRHTLVRTSSTNGV